MSNIKNTLMYIKKSNALRRFHCLLIFMLLCVMLVSFAFDLRLSYLYNSLCFQGVFGLLTYSVFISIGFALCIVLLIHLFLYFMFGLFLNEKDMCSLQ